MYRAGRGREPGDGRRGGSMKRPLVWALLIACLALAALAPSVRASSPAAVTHPTLVIGHPSSVAITYYIASSGVVLRGTPPTGRVVVSDPTTVGTLARLANNLNPPPTGPPPSCSPDNFSHARLVFAYSNGDRWTMRAELSGCERLTAHGVSGWVVGSQTAHPRAFFNKIDKLIGYHRQ